MCSNVQASCAQIFQSTACRTLKAAVDVPAIKGTLICSVFVMLLHRQSDWMRVFSRCGGFDIHWLLQMQMTRASSTLEMLASSRPQAASRSLTASRTCSSLLKVEQSPGPLLLIRTSLKSPIAQAFWQLSACGPLTGCYVLHCTCLSC